MTTTALSTTVDLDAKKLAAALRIMPKVNASALPILNNVRIQADRYGAGVEGTDLELTVRVDIPGSSESPVSFLVNRAQLADVLKGAQGTVRLNTGPGGVFVQAAGMATLPECNLEDWPTLPTPERGDAAILTRDEARFLATVKADATRPLLSFAFLDGDAIVATDSYRLYVVPVEAGRQDLVPLKALEIAAKLAKEIRLEPGAVRGEGFEIAWNMRGLTVDQWPAWRQLATDRVPAAPGESDWGTPVTWSADRDELVSAVNACWIKVRKETPPLRLTASDYLTVTSERDGNERIGTVLSYSGPFLETFGINPSYLSDALTMPGGDRILVTGFDHLKPWSFQASPNGPWALVMPVRLS